MKMERIEREKFKKKQKLYKRLGAEKFQKVVFKVEEIKFKVIKKCFPNFIKWYDKYCDFQKKISLKRAKTEEEQQEIIRNIKFAKMAMRKELNTEKNRNYHMDAKKPTEIIEYLKWNKEIHVKGLIKDGIVIALLIGGAILQIPGCIPLLAFEVLCAGINFECINIQNYNLCRTKAIEDVLKRREESRTQRNIEEFGQASEVIHRSIDQSESLPSFEEIIANIDNKEQLRQMRALLKREQEDRAKQKKLGGI